MAGIVRDLAAKQSVSQTLPLEAVGETGQDQALLSAPDKTAEERNQRQKNKATDAERNNET